MPDVVVLGSANLDLYARVPAIPAPGETVLAEGPERRAGGKGLNQAVAAARAGAATTFLGAVGADDAAELLLGEARAADVDVSLVRRRPGASGTAWIIVQPDGENSIIVLGAANRTITALEPAEREAIAAARVLVMQLETPLSAIAEAAAVAGANGTLVVLNASPVQDLDRSLVAAADVLVVNQHEAAHLAGIAEPVQAATGLRGTVPTVVVTLGADGAIIADAAGTRRVPGVRARVVDSTGAGDTFAGVLAATLAVGKAIDREAIDHAVARAVVAGAIAVEREGAVRSIPAADVIDARMGGASPGLG